MEAVRIMRGGRSIVVFLVLALSSTQQIAAQQAMNFSTVDDLQKDFTDVRCRNSERLEAVRKLFEKMGAPPSTIHMDAQSRATNLVVKLDGPTPEMVVVGAHYDLVERGCGAVDNWTGIVAMAHMFGNIRNLQPNKSVMFVAFGGEESGLLGSAAMVNRIPKDQLPNYCAMINLDSFGMGLPFALKGSSTPSLVKAAASLAERIKVPFGNIQIDGADSDSSPFISRKIPAITLSGLLKGWELLLHTSADQTAKVNVESVRIGYRLALALWGQIDSEPCQQYKK